MHYAYTTKLKVEGIMEYTSSEVLNGNTKQRIKSH
jgi:hypothetical protein